MIPPPLSRKYPIVAGPHPAAGSGTSIFGIDIIKGLGLTRQRSGAGGVKASTTNAVSIHG